MSTDAVCPDEAACHHHCVQGCWRVENAEPLSSAGMGDVWPASVRAAYLPVVQEQPTEPSPEQVQTRPADAPVSGEASPPTPSSDKPVKNIPSDVTKDAAHGVPLVDITGLVSKLGGSVLNLRGQAAILRKAADRLDLEAESMRQLRDLLNGDR